MHLQVKGWKNFTPLYTTHTIYPMSSHTYGNIIATYGTDDIDQLYIFILTTYGPQASQQILPLAPS